MDQWIIKQKETNASLHGAITSPFAYHVQIKLAICETRSWIIIMITVETKVDIWRLITIARSSSSTSPLHGFPLLIARFVLQ